jgi:FixJ family two-component response regulator
MAMQRSVVAIVDDGPEILSAMASLLSTAGYRTELFASAGAFLHAAAASEARCLAVDIQPGDISGLELVHHLPEAGYRFPAIS